MEKWMSKGRRSPLKADVDFPKNRNKNFERVTSPAEKKKGKKWTFGNFLRRKSKEPPPVLSMSTQTAGNETEDEIYAKIEIKPEIRNNTRIICSTSSENSMTSQDPNNPIRNGRKNRLKARIQAKREKYGNSSSEDENPSNLSLLRIHSADSIQNSPKSESYSNKRCRGARTERYMKRLHTNGENNQNLTKSQSKYPSDIGFIDDYRCYNYRNHSLFGSDYNIPNYRPPMVDDNAAYSKIKKQASRVNAQPPEPPPRSFKLHIYPRTMRYSLQNSDIENDHNITFRNKGNNVNCNSLDRRYTCQVRNFNQRTNPEDTFVKNRAPSPLKNVSWCRELEKPIIPRLQERSVISNNVKNSVEKSIDDKKRHSKNLEEALEELETIYNSLRLNDEDLLDRAEERSMEEYRDKIANTGIEGSIKSSDSTSSNEMGREVFWKNSWDNDVRMRDDMAYRRMHRDERPLSVDNYGSMSRMSYLANSPCLSYREMDQERPKSRRGTPDLTRDDVAFRSISHANNTLRILDPQPPFGIPLGPVSGAAESDYLHVEANKEAHCRSLYIPKSEPDVVADDLAFRSLRKDSRDRAQSPGNMSFLPKTLFTPEIKRRAVRSLSADLYGIINKDSEQSSWYREYVKLNRPLRISGIVESPHLDINGNKQKPRNYKGKIQVHVPQSEDNDNSCNQKKSMNVEINCDKINQEITTDHELMEYKELCRELENLIKKTSERVKTVNKIDSRRDSLTEFVKWEELLGNNNLINEDKVKGDTLESGHDDEHDKTIKINDTDKLIPELNNELDSSNMQVPSVSVSETTEKIFSSAEKLEDGSSGNEEMRNIEKTFENKNTTESSNDYLIESKETQLNSDCHDEINISTLNEGRETTL